MVLDSLERKTASKVEQAKTLRIYGASLLRASAARRDPVDLLLVRDKVPLAHDVEVLQGVHGDVWIREAAEML